MNRYDMKENRKKLGFTLTEALFVLIILGIIAAICMQSVKAFNAQQKGFDTKAEKAVSVLGQAIIMMLLEDSSGDDLTSLYDEEGKLSIEDTSKTSRVAKIFRKHLSVNELPVDTSDEYFSDYIRTYQRADVSILKETYSDFFYLQDGTLLGFRLLGSCSSTEANAIPPRIRERMSAANVCASIFVDVNGEGKPNRLGADQIVIPFDARGIKYNDD